MRVGIDGLKIFIDTIRGDSDSSLYTPLSVADPWAMVVVEDGDGAVDHHAEEACHAVPKGGVGVR
jgi:hypothetical protein